MEEIEWKDTQDGLGVWAMFNGRRLVVKTGTAYREADGGSHWWGVYDGDGLMDDGSAWSQEEACEAAEEYAREAI